MKYLEKLFNKIETTADNDLEIEIFNSVSEIYNIPNKPDWLTAFFTISSWLGTSERAGVWNFYEATDSKDINITLNYLSDNGYYNLKEIFAKGIHDYQNEKYRDNYEYPEKWLDESEEIDDWIDQHRLDICKWERKILIDNKSYVLR